MEGGFEQQIPAQEAVMAFALPEASYEPITQTGQGEASVFAPSSFFPSALPLQAAKPIIRNKMLHAAHARTIRSHRLAKLCCLFMRDSFLFPDRSPESR